MGKRRTERPVENGSFLDDFLEWMDCPEGQHSIEVSDLIFDALGAAGIDARRLKIVWADGTQLSIKQSAENRPGRASRHTLRPDRNSRRRWLGNRAPQALFYERLLE